jgi:hypothetical protein
MGDMEFVVAGRAPRQTPHRMMVSTPSPQRGDITALGQVAEEGTGVRPARRQYSTVAGGGEQLPSRWSE